MIPMLVIALDANARTDIFRQTGLTVLGLLQRLLAKEDVPSEILNKTELALLQWQAVPRLFKLLEALLPDFVKNPESSNHANEMTKSKFPSSV